MSDMLKRAADAIWAIWSKNSTEDFARAALLAALDPQDAAIRDAVFHALLDNHAETLATQAEAAVAAIKALAQGETDGH